jgi:hypothetical protein
MHTCCPTVQGASFKICQVHVLILIHSKSRSICRLQGSPSFLKTSGDACRESAFLSAKWHTSCHVDLFMAASRPVDLKLMLCSKQRCMS